MTHELEPRRGRDGHWRYAFVLMPRSEEFDDVFLVGVNPACNRSGIRCERVDDQVFDDPIRLHVRAEIAKADVLIADLTGRNPNIFYEVGFAHALKKPVILLARELADVPFELKDYKCVVYGGDFETLRIALEERLEWFEEHGADAATVPVTQAQMMQMMAAEPESLARRDQIFISYCHVDLRWLQRLQVHLAPLERTGNVTRFDDTMIAPGEDWRARIADAVHRSRVAVLFVSADFLASEFIFANELPPLLAAARTEGTVILPIIVSPCRFAKIANLAQFQSVNPPSRPLTKMTRNQQEELFVSLADTIETALFYGGPT